MVLLECYILLHLYVNTKYPFTCYSATYILLVLKYVFRNGFLNTLYKAMMS